ncbi:MAG: GNAT family N-acetyltransferase [Proteobacteria bacterium]|nr:GNAT family N-acetyltransferase [Pseudomonadota bacterium]
MQASIKPLDFLCPRLDGSTISLRPLEAKDFDGLLLAASDPEIWRQHSEPNRHSRDVFRKFFDHALIAPGALVIIENATGLIIGSTRFYDFDEDKRQVTSGYTFLMCKYWGGVTNRELKGLVLNHAFGFVNKVLFHASEGNIRSRRSLERLGAQQTPGLFDIPGVGARVEYTLTKKQWTEINCIGG